MNRLTLLRYIGNFLLVLGYYLILNVDLEIGLIFRVISGSILFYVFALLNMWDMFLATLVFLCIDAFKLSEVLFNSI